MLFNYTEGSEKVKFMNFFFGLLRFYDVQAYGRSLFLSFESHLLPILFSIFSPTVGIGKITGTIIPPGSSKQNRPNILPMPADTVSQ